MCTNCSINAEAIRKISIGLALSTVLADIDFRLLCGLLLLWGGQLKQFTVLLEQCFPGGSSSRYHLVVAVFIVKLRRLQCVEVVVGIATGITGVDRLYIVCRGYRGYRYMDTNAFLLALGRDILPRITPLNVIQLLRRISHGQYRIPLK